uniref:peptidoglycan recognition protein family protein n=1 Tax=Dysosmobacter sp. TaxID=2591382 RepID=UPI00262EE36B
DHSIYQHLPDGERGYHAGDGGSGPGNAKSIGIEICVNVDGDFGQAKANAAALVRLLMQRHGIPLANVVQHNHWNGKDCPKTIRATAGGWEAFLTLCGGEASQDKDTELEAAVDALAAAGVIDSPNRWKALEYTDASVRALIVKMAAKVKEYSL